MRILRTDGCSTQGMVPDEIFKGNRALREKIRLNRLKTDTDMYLLNVARWGLGELEEKPSPEDFGIDAETT